MSRARTEDDFMQVQSAGKYESQELSNIKEIFSELLKNRRKLSIKKLLEKSGAKRLAFVLNEGGDRFPCETSKPLIVPKITSENILKILRIAARCNSEGKPIRAILLLTNKLNRKIELYTKEIFQTSSYLRVESISRWYIP